MPPLFAGAIQMPPVLKSHLYVPLSLDPLPIFVMYQLEWTTNQCLTNNKMLHLCKTNYEYHCERLRTLLPYLLIDRAKRYITSRKMLHDLVARQHRKCRLIFSVCFVAFAICSCTRSDKSVLPLTI